LNDISINSSSTIDIENLEKIANFKYIAKGVLLIIIKKDNKGDKTWREQKFLKKLKKLK